MNYGREGGSQAIEVLFAHNLPAHILYPHGAVSDSDNAFRQRDECPLSGKRVCHLLLESQFDPLGYFRERFASHSEFSNERLDLFRVFPEIRLDSGVMQVGMAAYQARHHGPAD